MRARVTSKGQVTLPKPMRDALSIEAGDRLEFRLTSSHEVSLFKLDVSGTSAGVLSHLGAGQPVTEELMKKAVADRVRQKYGRE